MINQTVVQQVCRPTLWMVAAVLSLAGSQAVADPSSTAPAVALAATAQPAGTVPAPAKALVSVDDQARFLAGLPVGVDSPLSKLQQDPLFKEHAAALAEEWAELEKKRLTPMDQWAAQAIRSQAPAGANVYYFFGGPDFVSVNVLFPDAPTYLLCGLELVGDLPEVQGMRPKTLGKVLKNLRYSLRTTVHSSFFRTNEMSGDLTRTELRGVVPLLYLFLGRSNARIIDSALVKIDPHGAVQNLIPHEDLDNSVPGVRIRFHRQGSEKVQTLYYFRLDLENDAVAKKEGFFTFWKGFKPGNSFLKAASFILHNPHFSKTLQFLLENSATVLQDDSGIPYRALYRKGWDFAYFGRYLRPLSPFHRHFQKDLNAAFKGTTPGQLPFTTGYRHAGDANLLFAFHKQASPTGAAATPAPATASSPSGKGN